MTSKNIQLLNFLQVADLVEDLRDGTVLCALVEALQGRRLKGWSRNPTNQHHKLENVTTALQAIEDDGVKLVNIGKTYLPVVPSPELPTNCFKNCDHKLFSVDKFHILPIYMNALTLDFRAFYFDFELNSRSFIW